MADCGVLKPISSVWIKIVMFYALTETNLGVESGGGTLLSEDFLGVLEDAKLLLESSFSLYDE